MLAQSKHGRCDISTLDSRARPHTHHLARSRQISKELFSAVEGGGAFLTVGDGPPTKIRPSSVCTCTPSPICLPPRKLLPAPYASFLHPRCRTHSWRAALHAGPACPAPPLPRYPSVFSIDIHRHSFLINIQINISHLYLGPLTLNPKP
jgi:hypothetical protein